MQSKRGWPWPNVRFERQHRSARPSGGSCRFRSRESSSFAWLGRATERKESAVREKVDDRAENLSRALKVGEVPTLTEHHNARFGYCFSDIACARQGNQVVVAMNHECRRLQLPKPGEQVVLTR